MDKEYIERGAVLEILRKKSPGTYRGIPCYPDEISTSFREVSKIPAADVVEVVHGRWSYNNSTNFWQCSCCGVNAPIQGDFLQLKTNYCPNCGARMDGAE